MHECGRCGGLWADQQSIERIYADRDKQVQVLGAVQPLASGSGSAETRIRYLPCPDCGKLMNRVNFGRCSSVVVDVCKGHGTWFDRDELRRIVEFIRGGGLLEARKRELAELEERKRRLERNSARSEPIYDRQLSVSGPALDIGVSAAAEIFAQLLDR